MKKKLSSLYCTFVPCKSFVSDFFIVEKTFPFYEKFLFSDFAIFRFTIFEGRNFRENEQKSRKSPKFLPLKYYQAPFSPGSNKLWKHLSIDKTLFFFSSTQISISIVTLVKKAMTPSLTRYIQTFSAWCPLKAHTYLSKPAAFSDLLQDTRH